MNLYINSFVCENPDRRKELEYCLEKNEANEFIDNIHVLKKQEDDIFSRITFTDFFKQMKPGEVNIIANSDIYFDETIQLANQIREKEVWALTRWEQVEEYDHRLRKPVQVIMYFNRRNPAATPKFSQDVWIFRGRPNFEAGFGLGVNGCDNAIAYLFKANGYNVRNPSYSVRAIHVHKTPTQRGDYTVPRPYLWVDPCSL